jgi:hypothetical protein
MTTKDKHDGAFADVSKQHEQAQKDADRPAEFNEDGSLKHDKHVSQASSELSAEMSKRASATANGGGPWPPEVLRKQFVGNATTMTRGVGEYTSHES